MPLEAGVADSWAFRGLLAKNCAGGLNSLTLPSLQFLGLPNLGFGLFEDNCAIVHIRIIVNTVFFFLRKESRKCFTRL